MGPRSGSPATETLRARAVVHRRAATRGVGTALFLLVLGWAALSWANSAETSHNVTVVVIKPALSIQDDAGDFALTFDRRAAGSESNSRVVNYRVSGNSLPTGPLPGVVSASVSGAAEGIDLKADVGQFVNNGTEGNILLHAASSGEQVVGQVPVALAGKEATTGTQASVINGTLPVAWKASATQDLSSGNYPVTLTVTVKDT